jgi:molybdopterin synthase catalytic subunit
MINVPPEICLTAAPLELKQPIFAEAAGAVLDFYGVVRGQEDAREIAGLDYEAHEAMARHQLELLAAKAAARFAIGQLILHHRIGFVPVAEPSLFLRVSSAHRGTAFAAAQWIIDELKARIPIWKHPAFTDVTADPTENTAPSAHSPA